MLLVDCPTCGRRELRGVRSIQRLVPTDTGMVVTVTCRACGNRVRFRPGAEDAGHAGRGRSVAAQLTQPDLQAS